mmetsp:Transcript_104546/g.337145  ORF Transcript_104546/g.337145 Transcript_104546/m.337145 type:complete len:269 (+) Transcript_104546:626-1432(+)
MTRSGQTEGRCNSGRSSRQGVQQGRAPQRHLLQSPAHFHGPTPLLPGSYSNRSASCSRSRCPLPGSHYLWAVACCIAGRRHSLQRRGRCNEGRSNRQGASQGHRHRDRQTPQLLPLVARKRSLQSLPADRARCRLETLDEVCRIAGMPRFERTEGQSRPGKSSHQAACRYHHPHLRTQHRCTHHRMQCHRMSLHCMKLHTHHRKPGPASWHFLRRQHRASVLSNAGRHCSVRRRGLGSLGRSSPRASSAACIRPSGSDDDNVSGWTGA